jgi:sodium-dependent phosphate cotransporter
MSSPVDTVAERLPGSIGPLLGTLVTVLLFLFAVQLLGTATDAAAPVLERLLRRVVVGDASALGLGWLGAYALANGSVVAALGLTLFSAGLVSVPQLFLLVVGTRLGGAAIVVFIGALDYFQKERYSVRESVSMGLLTFLVTHSIYLPVTVLGYLALPSLQTPVDAVSRNWAVGIRSLAFIDPVTEAIVSVLGPAGSFILAITVLFGSLKLFDRILAGVDTAVLRDRLFSQFERTWLAFVAGLFVTATTTSVAFSLGVIVPLYNRGYVKREELVPYVLGANIGTLFDTLVVAIVLESAAGLAVVLQVVGLATLVTLVALVGTDAYTRAVVATDDRLLEERRLFVAFVAALVLVPLVLVLVPLVLG